MKNQLACLILALFLMMPIAGFGQGGYAGAFLRNGVGPRSEAMGRAYVAVVEGNESAFYNPAAVALFERRELATSIRALTLDRTFAYVSLGLPIHPSSSDSTNGAFNGGLSLSWIHARVDNIEARDFDGEMYGTLSNSENAFSFSFALQPHPMLAVGLTGRVVSNRFPGVKQDEGTLSTSSFGFDLGAMIQPVEAVRMGFAATNLSLKNTWNTQDVYERGTSKIDRFPRGIRAGIAVSRILPWLILSADFEKLQHRDSTIHFGAYGILRDLLSVRAGLNDGQLTLGAGYRFGLFGKSSELNYAYVGHPDNLDSDHVFGWVFVF